MAKVTFGYGDNPEFRVILADWDGVAIPQKDIERWIAESIEELEKNPDLPFTYTMSGDSLVIVARNGSEKYPYDIKVCTVRQHGDATRL